MDLGEEAEKKGERYTALLHLHALERDPKKEVESKPGQAIPKHIRTVLIGPRSAFRVDKS